MALVSLRRAENVGGDFFVDSTCIDCDLCRQIAPETFVQVGEQSAVRHQPETPEATFLALKALVTCPTSSIGTVSKHNTKPAVAAYPELIAENVFFCGFASEASFGAASYLVKRDAGNVMVDSPRFTTPLARRIEELGGVKWLFLTHRDDVADHVKWAAHFRAARVMHRADVGRATQDIENLLTGDEAVNLAGDLLAIPTPGHTRGHIVLLYRDRFLFTGDHLWWSPHYQSLYASRRVCWYNWREQTRSMEKLLNYNFAWVLPGHGRRIHAPAKEMRKQLERCVARMQIH